MKKTKTFGFPFLLLKTKNAISLPKVFILFFSLVLLSGLFLPIYSDEAVTKWTIARFFEEPGLMVSLFPQCPKMLNHALPFIFYPASLIFSLIYSQLALFGLRISGLFFSFLWLFGVAYWCFKSIKNTSTAFCLLAILISSSLALGVMPYIFVLARPEQILNLIFLFVFLACIFWRPILNKTWQFCSVLIFIVLLSCFFYIHPKTLFFLPFFVAAAYYLSKDFPQWLRALCLILPFIFAYQTYQEANLIASCDETPIVQKVFAKNALTPSLLLQSPQAFLKRGFTNLYKAPQRVVDHLIFQQNYQSSWLPAKEITEFGTGFLNFGIQLLLYILIFGSHLAVGACFFYRLAKRSLNPSIVLGSLLALGSISNSFFYEAWNFYSGSQFMPIAILLILTLLPQSCKKIIPTSLALLASLFMLFASVSMVFLLSNYLPAIIKNSNVSEAEIPGQPLSLPVFTLQKQLSQITELAQRCRLPTQSLSNLVVDHMTYYAFKESRNPIHVLYISEIGFGGDLAGGKLAPFLHQLESPGLLTRCAYVPPQLSHLPVVELGGYCCINFSGEDSIN